MHKNNKLITLSALLVILSGILSAQPPLTVKEYSTVTEGARQTDVYLPLLKNKRVAVITNITGVIGNTSIVDTLLSLKVNVKKILGPEHGFRSNADAGEQVKNNKDPKTGLPVVSLYGANKKPTKEQLRNVDVVVYDIQDIGTRFYTYISSMCYAMEACAENGKEFVVFDRPNPNGFYIDGPVLREELKSFLGLHKVPVVYGMTCGEYARMANEEGWLKNGVKCRLTVVAMKNYDRKASYMLPVKPSPNIPNHQAVLLYPGLGLFEGTVMSLGRGTPFPFQVVGHPEYPDTSFSFTPLPGEISKTPRYVNKKCYGVDLRKSSYITKHPRQLGLEWLIKIYQSFNNRPFFETGFNYHSGNKLLQEQLKNGLPEEEIRSSWAHDIAEFKKIRKKYLLYDDFE